MASWPASQVLLRVDAAVVASLAVGCDIQAIAFVFVAGAQADGCLEYERDHERSDAGVRDPDPCPDGLLIKLAKAPAVGEPKDRGKAEHAGEKRAQQSSDPVDAEGIERVIVTELGFQLHGLVTDEARE